jgi:hypothetical protein
MKRMQPLMKRVKRLMIFVWAAVTLCAALCAASCTVAPAPESAGPVKVVSFNLRRFDDAKAANRKTAGFMASLLRDVAVLQEGLQVSETAIREFAGLTGPNRDFVLGPAEGRTAFYRENFIFVCNKDRVTLIAAAVYSDGAGTFERPHNTLSGDRCLSYHTSPSREIRRSAAGLWRMDFLERGHNVKIGLDRKGAQRYCS